MPRGIRSVPDGIDQELWDFLNQLRNQLLEGQRFGYPSSGSGGAGGSSSGSGSSGGVPGGGGGGTEPDLTPPPTPSGVVITGGFASIFIETDPPVFSMGNGYNRTIVYGAKYSGTGPLPTFSSAVIVYEFVGEVGAFPAGDLGTQWHLWLRWRTNDGELSVSPSGGANGHQVTIGKIGNSDLGPLIVEADNLASGAVSARVAAEKAVTLTAFAAGIEPVTIVTGSTLPTTKLTETIYLTGTGKLYRWAGSAYTAGVATSDLTGVITAAQFGASIGGGNLAPNTNFKKHANGFPYGWGEYNNGGTARTFEVSPGGLFGTNFVRVTANAPATNTLGISTGTGLTGGGVTTWVPGQTYVISFWARAAGALAAGFKMQGLYSNMGFSPASELANPGLINGTWQRYVWRVVPVDNVHTPSGELYISWDVAGTLPSGAAFDICAVQVELGDVLTAYAPRASELLPGTITATEIADDAVTTPKLIAGAVVAWKIAADAVEADKIKAGAVIADKIAAGAVTTSKLLVAPVSLCPDPWFTDEAWWTATSFQFWYFETNSSYMSVPKHVGLWSVGPTRAPGTSRGHVWSRTVPAPAPGVRVRLRARMQNASNQPVYAQVSFVNAAGAGIDGVRVTAPAGASGTVDYDAQFTVPPNTAGMQFIIYNEGGTTFSGYALASAVMLDIAASAELIVDGAITTDKLAANSVVAGKIQAGAIGVDQLAAGAVRAQHLLVTGPGSLLPDGTFEDQENWGITYNGIKALFKTVTDAPAGRFVAYVPAGQRERHVGWRPGNSLLKTIPIDRNKRYRMSFSWRVVGSTSGAFSYATVAQIDSAGNLIGGNSGHEWYGWAIGATAPSAWARAEFIFGAGTPSLALHASCRFITPSFLLNWENAGGEVQIADVRIVEQVDASLIVDGAIIASKLSAGAIAVGSAAIADGAIRNALIENLAVDNAKIANVSVSKLTAGSINVGDFIQSSNYVSNSQGWRIHGNGGAEFSFAMIRGTLAAAQIGAGSITADKIDTRNLTIKDGSGNVIFGSGANVNAGAYLQPPSDWVNANIAAFGAILNADRYGRLPDKWTQEAAANRYIIDQNFPGGTAIANTPGSYGQMRSATPIPIDRRRRYRLSLQARTIQGAPTCYFGVTWVNAAGADMNNEAPPGWPGSGTWSYFGRVGQVPPSLPTEYAIEFGQGCTAQIPANAAALRIALLLNYNYAASGEIGVGDIQLTDITNTPQTLTMVAHGANAQMLTVTNDAIACSDAPFWAAGAYSRQSYVGGCSLTFSPDQNTKRFMMALNTGGDITDGSYDLLDWALYPQADGNVAVYESGASIGNFTTYVAGDIFEIRYDGSKVRYLKNGAELRAVTANITAPLFADSSFYESASVSKIAFTPIGDARTALAASASSINLQYNGDFSAGNDGWSSIGTVGQVVADSGINYYSSDWRLLPAGAPGNDIGWWLQDSEDGDPDASYSERYAPPVAIEIGKRYCISAYTGAHRCRVSVFAYIFNTAGGAIDFTPWGADSDNQAEKMGGQLLGGYKRHKVFYTVPATVAGHAPAYLRVVIRKWGTVNTGGNSYVFYGRVQVEEVGADAVNPGAWAPNGSIDQTAVRAQNKITSANVSTYIASAAIGWAQIGDLVINTGGGVRSGKTTYGSGTGWLIEYNNGTPRLDIGDANQYLRWTGTALEIKLNKITLSGTTPAGGSFPKNDTIVRSLGSCTITASGGTPPYTYSWSYAYDVDLRSNQSLDADTRGYASFSNNVASLSARGDNDCIVTVFASCTVVDSNGLAAVFNTAASGTFGLGPD